VVDGEHAGSVRGSDRALGLTGGVARLFVAVWPPVEVVDAIAALPRDERPRVRYVPQENWHVTLRFLGDAEPADVTDVLGGVALPPATARLGPAVTRLFKGVLGVPVEGLAELAGAVAGATERIGDPPSSPFIGHLTIARHKPGGDGRGLLHAPMEVEFDVGEIALVESRIDRGGARYETLATWPVG
jgi:2'-5' RNA ligase